jgi:hypothetical protein
MCCCWPCAARLLTPFVVAAAAAPAAAAAVYRPCPPTAAIAALVGATLPSSITLTLHEPGSSLPVDDVVKPFLHGKHRELPSDVLKVPSGQSLQACARVLSVYCPAGQSIHSVDPGL